MSDAQTLPRSALGRLQQIGKGGTAVIYRTPEFTLPDVPETVYKEYKSATLTHAGASLRPGLMALVRFRDGLAPAQRARWDEQIVWPLRVVVDDDGAACGTV